MLCTETKRTTSKQNLLLLFLINVSTAPYRIGTTGTLDGTKTHKLVLEGIFGTVKKVITTKKLMEQKSVADLAITCLLLDYCDEDRKTSKEDDVSRRDGLDRH